jgi:hypothetical protein
MPRFSIRNPYFILVLCLIVAVLGVTSLTRMPVDMFPAMNIPVVVVATFYSGMPPEQIETDITSPSRGKRDQSVLSAGRQSRLGGNYHLKPRDGATEATAAGYTAAGCSQVRCIKPARLPGHFQG